MSSDEPITITENDLVVALWGVDFDPPDAAVIAAKVMRNLRKTPMDTWCREHGINDQCPEYCPRGGGYFHGESPCWHHPSYGCVQPDGTRRIAP